MNRLRQAYYLLRYLGPRVVTLRAGVYLRDLTGATRRTYAERPWATLKLRDLCQAGIPTDKAAYARHKREHAPPFLFPLGQPLRVPASIRQGAAERQPAYAARLRLLAENRCVYFFRQPAPEPIDWSRNALEQASCAADDDWFAIPTYRPEQGDPRTMWEPGRAAWALDLARAPAHGFTGDAGELFWRWVDSFMEACPPYRSFQWKCGQESAVRFIAIAMGFWSLAGERTTTPKRWTQFAQLAWATGYRIAHHINYAVSQKNNHAISEACGLLLISHLFPEFEDAARWQKLGRRVLTEEIRRQVYADGTYVQHSMNYHRVMLQGALLALRLGELANRPFDRDIYDRLARGAEFLFQVMDPVTGRLPNYGNNDGAWMLPLSECDFTDFRPVIQSVSYLCHRRRMLPAGPWDEDLLWLFGPEAVMTEDVPPRSPQSSRFDDGGYYTLRAGESWAMTRCHTYRDRMAQCDMLHVDLWWRGQNVLLDAGVHRYYVPGRPDLEHYFKSTASHNNVEIDGGPASENVSRFLWFPWSRARTLEFESGDGIQWFVGELYDYDRRPWRIVHRRTLIALDGATWLCVDDLLGDGEYAAVLRWHLLDAPYAIDATANAVRLRTPRGEVNLQVATVGLPLTRFEVIRGRDEPGRVQGFAAPYYGERLPVPTLEAAVEGPLQMRYLTAIGLGQRIRLSTQPADRDAQCWRIATPRGGYEITLAGPFRCVNRMVIACRPHEPADAGTSRSSTRTI